MRMIQRMLIVCDPPFSNWPVEVDLRTGTTANAPNR
jgi:hypothetical protein